MTTTNAMRRSKNVMRASFDSVNMKERNNDTPMLIKPMQLNQMPQDIDEMTNPAKTQKCFFNRRNLSTIPGSALTTYDAIPTGF